MLSETCNLQGLSGIAQLDRVGPYLVIANRCLHEAGKSRRYALINEIDLAVHSFHHSQYAAVTSTQQHSTRVPLPLKSKSKTNIVPKGF